MKNQNPSIISKILASSEWPCSSEDIGCVLICDSNTPLPSLFCWPKHVTSLSEVSDAIGFIATFLCLFG